MKLLILSLGGEMVSSFDDTELLIRVSFIEVQEPIAFILLVRTTIMLVVISWSVDAHFRYSRRKSLICSMQVMLLSDLIQGLLPKQQLLPECQFRLERLRMAALPLLVSRRLR